MEKAFDLESSHAAIESIPGTRVLLNELSSGELVLIPVPTSSPNDPLNWSTWRRISSYGVICLWAFMLGGTTLSPGVSYVPLMAEFGVSLDYLNVGAALALLMLGLGNLFFNPLALHFGRRPIYLASALITCVSQIVAATAQNKATYNGARILLGIGAAPFEQLPALTADDLYFVHQRGLGLSFYVLAISTGSFLGPIAAGFVVESMGWRWVNWFYAIFLGVIALLVFFFVEETGFSRQNPDSTPRNYAQKLKLITRLPSPMTFIETMLAPTKMLADPLVWWCGIVYGFAVSWLSVMAFTSSTVFQGPTYGFSSSATGLTNIAPLIGAVLALYLGGAGTDRFMIWKARRNGGIMEPESRIYAVFFAGPVMAGGLILYGVGAAHSLTWIAPVLGMGLIGCALPIAAEVSLGYISECYPALTGEATTAVICIRNIIGCALTFSISPWIEYSGLQNTFVTVGMLALVVFVSGGLPVWFGKGCRRRFSKVYDAMVEEKSNM